MGYLPRKYRRITFACSSAVSYVDSKYVVHSIDRTNSCSWSDGGCCKPMTDGSGPLAGGKTYAQQSASPGSSKLCAYTHRKRLLDRALSSHDRDTLHVEAMVARTRQGESAFRDVDGQLERGEEHGVALHRVVAKRAGVHGDELSLACGLYTDQYVGIECGKQKADLENLEVCFQDDLRR